MLPNLLYRRAREVGQPLHDRPRFARHQLGNQLVVQPREKLAVARKIAAIQQRDRELHVVRIESLALGKRPRRRAQFQPQIPHFLRKTPDAVLELAFRLAAGMKKQNVDIGIRETASACRIRPARPEQNCEGLRASGEMSSFQRRSAMDSTSVVRPWTAARPSPVAEKSALDARGFRRV